MKGTTSLTLAALLVATEAIHLVERRGAEAAVVGMDIQRKNVVDPVKRDRLRRRSSQTVSETLDNEESLYFANATLGTPGQQMRFHLDTGSSDLWTNAASSRLCRSRENPCGDSGAYNANKSSTYKYLNSDFNISYADQSGAAGDYATDVLQFGAAMIQNLQFGIGYESSSAQSVLGIGYPDHEAQVILGTGSQYQNLPSIMVQNKLIQSEAYSLWLNDLDANTGSILFGGVDTEKYHGNLATLPIQLDPGSSSPEEFFITLTGITLGNQAIGGSLTEAVLLDSGSSLMYLPNDLASDLYNSVGAQYVESQGVAAVPCSMGTNHTALNFTFSGPVISVPMSELVIPGGSAGSSVFGEDASQEACTFGVLPAGDSNSVLGDPFLRSAYVVYDLSNNQISLAQTDFNSSTSNVMEIGTGKQAVPNASGVPNAATAQPGQTGGGRIGSPTSAAPTATSTSTSKPKGAASSSADVPVRVLGGIVGAAMVLLLAL